MNIIVQVSDVGMRRSVKARGRLLSFIVSSGRRSRAEKAGQKALKKASYIPRFAPYLTARCRRGQSWPGRTLEQPLKLSDGASAQSGRSLQVNEFIAAVRMRA